MIMQYFNMQDDTGVLPFLLKKIVSYNNNNFLQNSFIFSNFEKHTGL